MQVLNLIEAFFTYGLGRHLAYFAVWAVNLIFIITLCASIFSYKIRRKCKGFFVGVALFGHVTVSGACLLGFICGAAGLFSALLMPFAAALVFIFEWAVLCLMRLVRHTEEPSAVGCYNAAILSAAVERERGCVMTQNPKKPAIKGTICEVPLRRVENIRMDNLQTDDSLCPSFIVDCINKLKNCSLSAEDEAELSALEKAFNRPLLTGSREDKNALTDRCGRLITLLARYT